MTLLQPSSELSLNLHSLVLRKREKAEHYQTKLNTRRDQGFWTSKCPLIATYEGPIVSAVYTLRALCVCVCYLAIDDTGEDGLPVSQLQLKIHEGELVGADREAVVGEQNTWDPIVALSWNWSCFFWARTPLKPVPDDHTLGQTHTTLDM